MKSKNDRFLKNKVVLLTGGSGSWGQELTKQLLATGVKEIRIYSRGEARQTEMKRHFLNNPRLNFIIGDVREKERLLTAMRGVNYVIHLAALKHVPVVEQHPWEGVKTNVIGTQNVIEASLFNDSVEKVLYVSSDKAVDPLNLYGITKAASEKMITAANYAGPKKSFFCIRAGNILRTNGSVIPVFYEQLRDGNHITLTDPNMTRFFMSIPDIANFVLWALESGKGGEVFIPKMKAIKIKELGKMMINMIGNKKTAVRSIGIRPGEKVHELLISRHETPRTLEHKNYYVVLPLFTTHKLKLAGRHKKVTFSEFTSENAAQFSEGEMKKILVSEIRELEESGSGLRHKRAGKFFHDEGWIQTKSA